MKNLPSPDKAATQGGISRREFIARTALYGSTFWLLFKMPRPMALQAAQESVEPAVLSDAEWHTVEAITGRIIPADDEPGAIEANCVNFIDKALAHEDKALRRLYTVGLAGINAVSRETHGLPFVELAPEQQDQVLMALEDGNAAGWAGGAVSSEEFFETVRVHTVVGFLADPRYGGNRDYEGWKVLGYPGPRHVQGGYTPEQMLGKAKIKSIWGEDI